MNHLAYLALAMTDLREREVERAIELRRKRVTDDDAPTRLRDHRWAAVIHHAAVIHRAATTRAIDAAGDGCDESRQAAGSPTSVVAS
jgi:hypothetical protein